MHRVGEQRHRTSGQSHADLRGDQKGIQTNPNRKSRVMPRGPMVMVPMSVAMPMALGVAMVMVVTMMVPICRMTLVMRGIAVVVVM
jgi:hypothetical protein